MNATPSSNTQLLLSEKSAVKMAFFAAYQDRLPNAIKLVETALATANSRGFNEQDTLIDYFKCPNENNRSRGDASLDQFLAIVSAQEFFTLSGIAFVEMGKTSSTTLLA